MTTLEYGLCLALIIAIGLIVHYRMYFCIIRSGYDKAMDALNLTMERLKEKDDSMSVWMTEQRKVTNRAVINADNFNIERDNLRFENTKLATQLKTAVDKIAELNEAIGALEVTFDESYQEPQPRESDGRFARKLNQEQLHGLFKEKFHIKDFNIPDPTALNQPAPFKQLCDVVKDMQEEPLKVGDYIKGKHFGSETYTEGPILFFGHFTKKPNVGCNFLMLDTCKRVPRK